MGGGRSSMPMNGIPEVFKHFPKETVGVRTESNRRKSTSSRNRTGAIVAGHDFLSSHFATPSQYKCLK